MRLGLLIFFCLLGDWSLLKAEPSDDAAGFYEPVERELEGWTIAVDPRLLAPEHQQLCDQALGALANHLQRIKFIVPDQQVEQLMKLRIWIELDNPTLESMQYHPSRGWLERNGHDPKLEKHVHIPHARDLIKRSTWAKHPYVILHELAHAYHDQVLGFDQAEILAAFESAQQQGIYSQVLLYTGEQVEHYAMSNHKEYFAESTEAYLGVNDFYPFVRAELNQHDPLMYQLLEKIWGPVR
jgi:hypothetical protein